LKFTVKIKISVIQPQHFYFTVKIKISVIQPQHFYFPCHITRHGRNEERKYWYGTKSEHMSPGKETMSNQNKLLLSCLFSANNKRTEQALQQPHIPGIGLQILEKKNEKLPRRCHGSYL